MMQLSHNNPLHILHRQCGGGGWLGARKQPTADGLVDFTSPQAGWRAAWKVLESLVEYQRWHDPFCVLHQLSKRMADPMTADLQDDILDHLPPPSAFPPHLDLEHWGLLLLRTATCLHLQPYDAEDERLCRETFNNFIKPPKTSDK